MSYWFFFSYARLDRDEYLKKFFEDLKNEVRVLSGELKEDAVGFFDGEEIEPGAQWGDALSKALQECRTFVSIFSPTYFQKEYCGKEWQVFRSRQKAYQKTLADPDNGPGLILPVLWVPEARLPTPLPPTVGSIQYSHDDFGSEYARQGLKQLIKLRKYEDDYLNFVATLAGKLVDAAKQHVLPRLEDIEPIEQIRSAFHSVQDVPPAVPGATTTGPRYVQFIYIAENRHKMSALRQKLDAYGIEGGKDWIPYCPDVNEPVAFLAQDVATQEKLFYEEVRLTEDLIKALEKSEKDKKLVVMIVDTWTLKIEEYKKILRQYDDRSFINCVVLVPWNASDTEAQQESTVLETMVRQVFIKRSLKMGAPHSFLYPVNSPDDLKKELLTAIYKTRERILEQLEVEKIAFGDKPIAKPIISGPGGK
ncbi:MAG: TIR domain-containing protein [Acidobacteriota bacterium]|nr:MAG: TIR domain-containing protein [Acidobacteriota bacterium]